MMKVRNFLHFCVVYRYRVHLKTRVKTQASPPSLPILKSPPKESIHLKRGGVLKIQTQINFRISYSKASTSPCVPQPPNIETRPVGPSPFASVYFLLVETVAYHQCILLLITGLDRLMAMGINGN